MITKILVPLDGSSAAEMSLAYAEALALKNGASIMLVTAAGRDSKTMEPLFGSYLEKTASAVSSALMGKRSIVETRILQGAPADEILRFADEGGYDLIVMSSRGATGPGPWQLGSIAIRVTIASPHPVLVVKNPALTPPERTRRVFERILVPLDGSDTGEAALSLASEIAQLQKSRIILFYALQPNVSWAGNVFGGAYATIQEPENTSQSASSYLQGVQKRLAANGIDAEAILQNGPPAELIINYARRESVDLIAMSTHGRSGISRWLLGSVTEKVLTHGGLNVLVVPAGR